MLLSVLDQSPIRKDGTAQDAVADTIALAKACDRLGYHRYWLAEHHNSNSFAGSCPEILIGRVAQETKNMRIGSGGVMMTHYSPLKVAEQFRMLDVLYPGRIDLGLGRAPGSDQATARALRRGPESADTFPQDVLELQGFLTGETRIPGVRATPGDGSNVPLYILGSSLFGAQLAAALGLPYAFASHFAPDALMQATELYREEFRPSAALSEPYLIVAANLIAAETEEEADAQYQAALRWRAQRFLLRGQGNVELSDAELDALLATPGGEHVKGMMRVTAVGTPKQAADYVEMLAERTVADEVILAPASPKRAERIRAVELVPAPSEAALKAS